MFNPQRFALARRRRGLKKRELAKAVGVTERSVSAYESGDQEPESATLKRICEALQYPEEFFFGDDPEIPTPDAASFRSLSRMTSSQRDVALGAGAMALLLNRWIEQRFDLPRPDLPDLGRERFRAEPTAGDAASIEEEDYASHDSAQDPEAAADMLRAHWGLGVSPVKHMIALLESKGVRVYSLAIDAREVDAFSMWSGDQPFVFLNTYKSAEHCRFDAAHELGHLVLHRHAQAQGPDLEREANAFASAFLMPRSDVLAAAPATPSIVSLIKHKKRWSVSAAALNYRLHALKITSDWTYRTLCIHLAQAGHRTDEPEPIPHEKSVLLEKVFAELRSEGLTKSAVAAQLSLVPQEINELTFGLMLHVLRGGNPAGGPKKAGRTSLRLVKG